VNQEKILDFEHYKSNQQLPAKKLSRINKQTH